MVLAHLDPILRTRKHYLPPYSVAWAQYLKPFLIIAEYSTMNLSKWTLGREQWVQVKGRLCENQSWKLWVVWEKRTDWIYSRGRLTILPGLKKKEMESGGRSKRWVIRKASCSQLREKKKNWPGKNSKTSFVILLMQPRGCPTSKRDSSNLRLWDLPSVVGIKDLDVRELWSREKRKWRRKRRFKELWRGDLRPLRRSHIGTSQESCIFMYQRTVIFTEAERKL